MSYMPILLIFDLILRDRSVPGIVYTEVINKITYNNEVSKICNPTLC